MKELVDPDKVPENQMGEEMKKNKKDEEKALSSGVFCTTVEWRFYLLFDEVGEIPDAKSLDIFLAPRDSLEILHLKCLRTCLRENG